MSGTAPFTGRMRDTTSLWSLPEVRFGSLVGLEFAMTGVARHLSVDTGPSGRA